MALPSRGEESGRPPALGRRLTVTDVDATARRALRLGGRVVHGPADVMNVGRMTVIIAPPPAAQR